MPIKTQIRLQQLTGTLDDTVSTTGDINESSLQGVMDHLAASIQRIHGTTGFAASEAGQFNHTTMGVTGSTFQADSTYRIKTRINELTLDGNAGLNLAEGGANIFTISDSRAVAMANHTTLDFDGSGNVTIDSSGGTIGIGTDNVNQNINIGTAGTRAIGVGSANATLTFTGDAGDITLDAGSNDIAVTATQIDATAQNAFGILLADSQANAFSLDASGGQADLLKVDTSDDKVVIHALDVTNSLKALGNLQVTGDLTVDGTTTTLNTANLTVEDPFLLLGDSAQVANSNSGIIFVSGSSAGSSRPDVSFARVANDTWALGSIASNSGSITDATSATIDVNMRALSFEIVDSNNAIKDTSNELHIDSDNKIRLDVGNTHVVSLRENGTEKGIIDFNSNTLIMSSTLGALELMSATGGILFQDTHDSGSPRSLVQLSYGSQEQASLFKFDAAQGAIVSSQGGNELALGFSSGGYLALGVEDTNLSLMGQSIMAFSGSTTSNDQVDAILLLGKDSSPSAGFEPSPDFLNKTTLTISGSALVLDNGASSSEAQLKFKASTSGNFVTLAAPATVGTTLNLVLPATDGGNGDVLQTDGAGNLSFVPQGGASAAIKQNVTVTKAAGFAANDAVAFSTAADFEGTPGALDVSSVDASNRINAIDVFVNGQLLMSGTSAPGVNVTGGDYVLVDVGSASASDADLKFAFGIEADDVISVIIRA